MGREHPRLAPPTPARSQVAEFTATARSVGVDFLPWQTIVGRYLYALGKGERWLFPEVAVIAARQNGKTEIIKAQIMHRLAMRRNILHVAQTRTLPRKMFFNFVAPFVKEMYPDARIWRAAGYEAVERPGGGSYTITAATGPGPRGLTVDDLIIDELREIDEEFIGASMPTLGASLNPQVLYLSNAGAEDSVSLNAVRRRADDDPSLAYLEWSAAPDRAVDDVAGWAEANPSIGHFPRFLDGLERAYRSDQLAGTLANFETERLCRWVVTTKERFVSEVDWMACRGEIGKPLRPAIGVAMDPDGRRASVVMAWLEGSRVALTLVADLKGDPIDTEAVGVLIRGLERKHNAKVGYDAHTDAQLAKYVGKAHAENVNGLKHVAASGEFGRRVASGGIAWQDADALSDDLTWTSRTAPASDGSWHAVRANDDHPITAALAAIRAVWLASDPKRPGGLRVQ